jgi:hypothetical protein
MIPCSCAAVLLAAAAIAAVAAEPLLPHGGFDDGLSGWKLAPGEPSMVSVVPAEGIEGHAVHLRARGQTLGLDSDLLVLGQHLDPAKTYEVSARLMFGGLTSGIAAFSVCALDATGKRLAQYAIQSWRTDSKPHGWLTRSARIGPGTDKSYPEGTQALHLRLSFHEPTGNCAGEIALAEVELRECAPSKFAHWPASILVQCADLGIRFESRSFWTLYRIDYQGTRIGMDVFGSHYGSVANVKGLGFIGSGHTENGETEEVEELTLVVDGKPEALPKDAYSAADVTLRKRSRLRDLALDTTVHVTGNRILEEVAMSVSKPMALNYLYHFMHPWVPAMSDFLAEGTDGTLNEGRFADDKGMKVCAPVRWSAVFSEALGKGAVTRVLEAPAGLPWEVRYWDMPERYRKHYFMVFSNATVEPGRTYRYRVLTIPFAATADTWRETARGVAREAEE